MLGEVCTNSALHETFNSNNGAYLWPKVPCKRYISVLIRFLDVTVTYPTTFFYRYRCLMYQVYKYVYIILIIIVARRKHLHSIVYLAAKLDRITSPSYHHVLVHHVVLCVVFWGTPSFPKKTRKVKKKQPQ